jgi:carbon starvation protein
MLTVIFLFAVTAFAAAYLIYGRFLTRFFDIDNARPTPAHTEYDGVDRVPANPAILLGHHFSSIAGAGPIIGPVLAALAFGWLPVLLWVVAGSILIGGVHDFATLVVSIRHRARSIAEIARQEMSPLSYRLFLSFIWLTLVYILIVFLDLTAATFVMDGAVATASMLFIVLAVAFGLCVYHLGLTVGFASAIFVPLVFGAVWAGESFPLSAGMVPAPLGGDPGKTWNVLLVIYCLAASTMPVWVLLQPRDYLSSFLLYASVLAGFVGILLGGIPVRYPAFLAWSAPELGALFPILFITVACGACSGFHSIVASGTSSKQLDRESDAKLIGYGGMLIEGVVAVIALATVMMLPLGDPLGVKAPLVVYGTGIGKFVSVFGVPERIGYSFGILALSTFILTTLDTATRLGRYIFEEFFGLSGTKARYGSTLATLFIPSIFVLITLRDARGNPVPAWKVIWPAFGATNQLLAALTLLVITLWLKKGGKRTVIVLVPMVFMIVMTVWALALLIGQYGCTIIGAIAAVLLVMAFLLVWETMKALRA